MANDAVPTELLDITRELLPDVSLADARTTRGEFHDVVLLPGRAAVRIARNANAAAALGRRTELTRRIATLGLPFAVPEPLTEVRTFSDRTVPGRTAVALSWLDGAPRGRGEGDAKAFAQLLGVLAEVDWKPLADVLGVPHEYAGGPRWAEFLEAEAVPRLPAPWRDEARRRVAEAVELPEVPPSLVHGDLSGGNLFWSPSGQLLGVLDWDLASPFDPAMDGACLGWHGWDFLRPVVAPEFYRRAVVWYQTFGIEHISAAVLNGDSPEMIDYYVERTVEFMKDTEDLRLSSGAE